MRAYSLDLLDLREKIVNLYEEGNISQRQLAKQFQVALSFIQKMLRQKLELGHVNPKIRLEQTPTKLNQEQLMILEQLVADNSDATRSTDALTFEAFVSQKLVPNLWKGACVIMDNCSIRKGAEIEALITKAGAKLIYLSPYSPDFSPIENCWSKIKSGITLCRLG